MLTPPPPFPPPAFLGGDNSESLDERTRTDEELAETREQLILACEVFEEEEIIFRGKGKPPPPTPPAFLSESNAKCPLPKRTRADDQSVDTKRKTHSCL